jgi:hypothetical protein
MATFGFSVGDFIAAITLVKDLIDALQDSGGASDHFLSVIRELREVENALKGVRQLKERLGSYPQQAAIEQAAAQCRYCIDEFLKTITRFQPRLRLGGSGEMLRDGLRKIQWTLCRKRDAQAFLATLHGHRSSITVLLGLMQACVNSRYSDRKIFLANNVHSEATHEGFRLVVMLIWQQWKLNIFLSTQRGLEAAN